MGFRATLRINGRDVPVETDTASEMEDLIRRFTPAPPPERQLALPERERRPHPVHPSPDEVVMADPNASWMPWTPRTVQVFMNRLSGQAQTFIGALMTRWPLKGVTVEELVDANLLRAAPGIGPLVSSINRIADEMNLRRPIMNVRLSGVDGPERFILFPPFREALAFLAEAIRKEERDDLGSREELHRK